MEISKFFEAGTVLPKMGEETLKNIREFTVGSKNPNISQVFKVYEGNKPKASDNFYLREFIIKLDEKKTKKKYKN